MKFAALEYSWLFFILAGLIGLFLITAKRRTALLQRFASAGALPRLSAGYSRRGHRIKMILTVTGMALIIIALLRPQWGFVWEEVHSRGVDVLVAVDVSKSMLTNDVLPSRLARTKLAIEDLVKELKGDRIGLIAFAGSAFVQCPLTIDYNGFLLAAEGLNPEIIPLPGTNIESAVNQALDSFATGSEGVTRVLIIITDGESHEGDPVAAAVKAAKENIVIYTIGVGTTEGELISVTDSQGQSSFLKDAEGRVVKSRLNETLLQDIALKSNGMYIKATPTRFGLEYIYDRKILAMEKKDLSSNREKHFLERFQIPLALAVFLLFLEPVVSDKKNR
ncbi:MAG: VWA domain-containing protein [Candidatus Omnitrophica bacterium]|nr:VWA domain-containing protein [Candidatus Omnitrophota bacterium]